MSETLTTIRETSIAVYHQIREEGLLSSMRLETFDALWQLNGPSTAAEISDRLKAAGVSEGGGRAGPGNVSARLTELRALGVVVEVGERPCRVTGRTVIVWDVTGRLPTGTVSAKQANRLTKEQTRAAYYALRDLVSERMLSDPRWACPEAITALGRWLGNRIGAYSEGS